MKIVVTGGTGFVGSHLVDRLISEGHSVIIIDHQKSDRKRFIHPDAIVYKASVGDSSLEDIFKAESPEAIFHLAAQISVTRSINEPIYDAQINIMDALYLLDLAARYNVKRFVFASSGGAIYGDHPVRPTPEDMNASPLSPYGVAKQSFEHYLQHFSDQRNLSGLALRFSNIYGPRQQMTGGYAGVMPIFISKLLNNEHVTVFGDGSSTRDYLFVEDAVDAFLSALESNMTGVVNISTEQETSVLDLWYTLQDIHGEEGSMSHEEARPGEVQRSHLSPKLAAEKLGWKAKTSMKEGLKKTYDWMKGELK